MKKIEYNRLFETGKFGNLEIKNRVFMAPMGTEQASHDGFVTEKIKNYYEARARGGVALVIIEVTAVHPGGQIRQNQLQIWDDKFVSGLRELSNAIHRQGAMAAVQLHHAGRLALSQISGLRPVGPSALPMSHFHYGDKGGEIPKELTIDEIHELVNCFCRGAWRAKEAGFDGVEIHGGHGYLFAQFLSRAANVRKDAYGGSLQNRARFLVETIVSIKTTLGNDYPVWPRINGKEYGIENGITLEEAKETALLVQDAGADAIHVTATGPQSEITSGGIPLVPELNVGLAGEIKKVVSVPVIAVGYISAQSAERILSEGLADFIAIGRPLIADPEWANKVASGKLDDINPCIRCLECLFDPRNIDKPGRRCSVNAAFGKEKEYQIIRAKEGKTVLIAGGGPAGMEAARVCALRGHRVLLYEREDRLGGQLNQACIAPKKERVKPLLDYLITQVTKLGVNIKLGTWVTAELIKKIEPDAVVMATGAIAVIPEIRGITGANVIEARQILAERAVTGAAVAIIGGELVGSETAEVLAETGKQVTVTTLLPELAMAVHPTLRLQFLKRLDAIGVKSFTGVKSYEAISSAGVEFITSQGERKFIHADTVVLAAGYRPDVSLLEKLKSVVNEVYLAGDCVEARRIMEAIADGSRIAREI